MLNIDGSGAKSILLGNQAPSNIGMVGTKVVLWYDGTAYQMFGSQRNADTNTTYTGWGFTPTAITTNTTGLFISSPFCVSIIALLCSKTIVGALLIRLLHPLVEDSRSARHLSLTYSWRVHSS